VGRHAASVAPKLTGPTAHAEPVRGQHGWAHNLVLALLPGVALVLTCSAGWLKWSAEMWHENTAARTESMRAASDAAIAMLTYRPDTAQNDVDAAKDRLTGQFRNSYSARADEIVVPTAIRELISASATVPPPTNTASSVRVALERLKNRWLISDFEPV
jgi:Mce-associated membrane protein